MSNQADKVISILKNYYKEGGVTLTAETPFQLLVATILSAQCTDERVNLVSKTLFDKYSMPERLANADFNDVAEIIKPLGFYNQKAKHIIAAAKKIVNDFNGELPSDRKLLQTLPGVGRKTANIILSRIFNIPAIAVDTHVKRVSTRLFNFNDKMPEKIEEKLMQLLPKSTWNDVNLTLIFHGRAICKPRKPLCNECPVNIYCKYFKKGEKVWA